MNIYGNLVDWKALTGNESDSPIIDDVMLLTLEDSAREVDRHVKRFFYSETKTREYRPKGGGLKLFIHDLISVDTFKVDTNDDGTFNKTFAVADYELQPLSDYPKTWVRLDNAGDETSFFSKTEIVGTWGWGNETSNPWKTISVLLDGAVNDAEATLIIVDSVNENNPLIKPGMTLLIGSEQIFVEALNSSTVLNVERGVNGTTAATHLDDDAISIALYPSAVVLSTYMAAARLWVRRRSGFGTVIGDQSAGAFNVHQGLDPDVKRKLEPFMNQQVG